MAILSIIYVAIFGCCVFLAWGFAQMPLAVGPAIHSPLALELVLTRRRKTTLARWLDRLAPWIRWLVRMRLGEVWSARLDRTLGKAGRVALDAVEFIVLKLLVMVGAAAVYVSAVGVREVTLPWLVLAALAGFLLPDLWLRHKIDQRRRLIERDLPEAVDLLTLCVGAGGDFMNALNRVVREYRRCILTEELAVVIQEIRMGKRRREALRNFARRIEIPEVSSLVRTLVQADRMGTGIGEALRIHSEDSRLRRTNRAERFAARAPIKMLVPLLLIMAAVVGIVATPIMMRFLQGHLLPAF